MSEEVSCSRKAVVDNALWAHNEYYLMNLKEANRKWLYFPLVASLGLILSLDGQSLSRFITYMTEVSFMW